MSIFFGLQTSIDVEININKETRYSYQNLTLQLIHVILCVADQGNSINKKNVITLKKKKKAN